MVTAKHQSRDTRNTFLMSGLWEGILRLSLKLMEVQSSRNWVSSSGVGLQWIWHVGWTCATVFRSSGNILLCTSAIALHCTMVWATDSTGVRHRTHEELVPGWSSALLSAVKKSPARNLMWARSFLTSWVVTTSRSAGWGRPDKPRSCTFRYFIFELFTAFSLSFFSWKEIILVLIRMFHFFLVQAGSCSSRKRGLGSEYILHSICTWLLHVVDVVLHIFRIYITSLKTVVLGLLQRLWKRVSTWIRVG